MPALCLVVVACQALTIYLSSLLPEVVGVNNVPNMYVISGPAKSLDPPSQNADAFLQYQNLTDSIRPLLYNFRRKRYARRKRVIVEEPGNNPVFVVIPTPNPQLQAGFLILKPESLRLVHDKNQRVILPGKKQTSVPTQQSKTHIQHVMKKNAFFSALKTKMRHQSTSTTTKFKEQERVQTDKTTSHKKTTKH